MASAQPRAFVQKLSKQHPADVRKQMSDTSYPTQSQKDLSKSGSTISCLSSTVSLNDFVNPLDYEEFLQNHHQKLDRDPLSHLLDFPDDDIEVCVVPRKIRTQRPIVPEEPFTELPPHVQDCVRCYTSDWLVVNHQYRHHSSSSRPRDGSLERQSSLVETRQEYEVDGEQSNSASITSSMLDDQTDSSDSTLRGSWASFSLRNSMSDSLIPSLLERVAPEAIDQANEARRQDDRQASLYSLYSIQDDDEVIERRVPGEIPTERLGHRLLVKCLALKLSLEVEPIFASMALYDCKERKKLSENFYFDLNAEGLKKMLQAHVPYSDLSTMSRTCVFDVTHPTSDLFLVIKLEKVLQGDVNDCCEPYIKEDKNVDKVKANAVAACDRLGKYRMPFAWTAIHLMNVVQGVNTLERDTASDKDSSGSNSLDRKSSSSSLEQLRKRASDMGSLTRRGSLERRSNQDKQRSWSPEDVGSSFDTFRPITLTIQSFFKQESERLKDDDLYKFLQELKRTATGMKKLKVINGTLKLDIAPCPAEHKYSLTPELERLIPYPDDNGRPTKEVLEFPASEVFSPHYSYRNLMFVYPKEVNFSSRAGSARNITVKVQLMGGEDELSALPVIFGKSSCVEFTSEAYTTVIYHNKCPNFHDEIKLKLPANLGDEHHLFFTFYHISCQRKVDQPTVETPIGYTWLALCRDGRLQSGELCLPVMSEPPPANYSYIPPDVLLPGTKWVDNHKPIFVVNLRPASTVHTQDQYLDKFLNVCTMVESGNIPPRIGDSNIEKRIKKSLVELSHAKSEPLVRFLPLVLDKLLALLVKPAPILGLPINISQAAFSALTTLVRNVSALPDGTSELHERHSLLTTYIKYQCTMPRSGGHLVNSRPGMSSRSTSLPSARATHVRSSSNPDMHAILGVDQEVDSISRGLDRTCSMRTGPAQESLSYPSQSLKLVHEELALQWVVATSTARELAMSNAWFLLELMVRSVTEDLALNLTLDSPRKTRFSYHFSDDIATLAAAITTEMIMHWEADAKLSQSLNCSLAFFFFDLLSIMDRGFVLSLIKSHCKQIADKMASLTDSTLLAGLKLDFLRIVCSHEHFVPLNLPFNTPLMPSSAPASPNPSISSSTSQSSFISTLISTDKMMFAELSPEYRQQHFLVGLVLTDLVAVLQLNTSALHGKAVNVVRNLMAHHDADPRYRQPEYRARVAALYLPLLSIITDVLPQMYASQAEGRGRSLLSDDSESPSGINQSVAMAIAGTTSFAVKPSSPDMHPHYSQNRKCSLTVETTRNLLMCFLWVIKNADKSMLQQLWCELACHQLHRILEVLHICITSFEYRQKKAVKHRVTAKPSFTKNAVDIKSRLEDVILGQGSARNEMILRRQKERQNVAPAVGERLRWRKEQMVYRSTSEPADGPHTEEVEAVEGNLATEVSLTILDTLERIVQVTSQSDNLQGLLGVVLKVLLHALSRNQSTIALQNMFATQRSLVFKFPNLLFDEETEQCADLCLQLLKHCSSNMASVRSQASASLYLLMRQNFEIGNNFARVKMQVTMSLSSLVGTSATFNEESLRRSLKTILVYAEEDHELQDTTFPEQVKDLVFNLHMILSDTVKMKEFQEDPEMLLDLMYRIAKGYQNSPDLRLTWLANMAGKHIERKNPTEAGMCLVHSAALVAEYLHMLEDRNDLPIGAAGLERITPNALEESAVSDDVLSPEEEGVCLGKDFTEAGLIGLLEYAAICFNTAGMYEAMNNVYSVLIPIAESNRDYKRLTHIHGKLHEAFSRVDQLQGKRVFGTYFRVGFYGSKFGDLNGEEFIYKEPTLTKLPEIFSRLENFYAERFGPDNIVVIKDSNTVDLSRLNPEKAYLQITYVEPFFEAYEMRYRATYFDKNFNMKRFVYATPFTPAGRPHGELHEQFKRKTILTTANHFPYIKTRIQVIHRKQIELTPIEVAIEDIQKKTTELAIATQQEPPDPKILQMVLQGCIGTTVNQGPMEIAVVFLADLKDKQKSPTKLQNKLRLCFKDFSKKCTDALKKNKYLIGPDQRDYQRELERNNHRFQERLAPLITICAKDSTARNH